MQHVLRCWERQSDDTEYKKTLRRPGLRPGPRWGSLQRSRKPPIRWGGAGCPLSKNPIPRSRPFGPRLSYRHSKISSDAVGTDEHADNKNNNSLTMVGIAVKSSVWLGTMARRTDCSSFFTTLTAKYGFSRLCCVPT